MNHILSIPDLTILSLVLFVLAALFLWLTLELVIHRNRPRAENSIVGYWRKGSGMIVMRFYSTEDQSFEAQLVFPKLIPQQNGRELIIIRGLK